MSTSDFIGEGMGCVCGGAALIELIQLDYIKGAVSHVEQTRKWDALRVDLVWSAHVRIDGP